MNNIINFVIKRAINAVLTLILLIVLVFILIHLLAPNPIDMARIYAGNPHAPYSELSAIEVRYGLNKPIYDQIIIYIKDIFTGNWGFDPIYKVPELTLIARYLPRTLELVIPAVIISVLLGLFTGAFAASHRKKAGDYTVKGVYLFTWASPPFLVAIFLDLIIAFDLKLLPAYGFVNPLLKAPPNVAFFPLISALIDHDYVYAYSVLRHMILPVVTLSLISFGVITRLTRSSMLDIVESDYFKMSLMEGMPRSKAIRHVALRNAAIPLVTLIALEFAYAIAGGVVVEDIFDYHGLGWFIYISTVNFDYIAILDSTIIIGILVIAANFIADVLYGIIDPRVTIE